MSEDRDRLQENADPEQADDDVEAHHLVKEKDPTLENSEAGEAQFHPSP